jgi:hypothetical protein
MEVIADLHEDMFGRLPLKIAQLVDTAALHGRPRPDLPDGAPEPDVTVDDGQRRCSQAARDEVL